VLWLAAVTWAGALADFKEVFSSSGLFHTFSMFRGTCFVIVLLTFVRSVRDIEVLTTGLLALGAIQMPILFCQKLDLLGINDWLSPRYSLIYESSIYSLKGFRTDGTFGNPNHAAVALVPIMAMGYGYYLFKRKPRWKRVFAFMIAASLLFSSVAWMRSRAGFGGMVAAIAALYVIFLRVHPKRALLHVVLIGAALAAITPLILSNGDDGDERFKVFSSRQALQDDYSVVARGEMWREGMRDLGNDILVGKGLGAYEAMGFFDSGYVSYVYAGGIVEVLLFLLLCVLPAIQAYRVCVRSSAMGLAPFLPAASCAIFGSMIVTAVSHPILFVDKLWLPYVTVIILGYLWTGLWKKAIVDGGRWTDDGQESRFVGRMDGGARRRERN
jgi:hypothetical protein